MEDVEKCVIPFEDSSITQSCAKMGSSETACNARSATAPEFLTPAALERATTSHLAYVTAKIELSMSHWSELVEIDCTSMDGDIAPDNLEVFTSLQTHPTWGGFFCTFGYDIEVRDRSGEMAIGEKFAEGMQAELFHAHITWRNLQYDEYCKKLAGEWVLKVFMKGTSLRQLQKQWPQGYLIWWANDDEGKRLGYPPMVRSFCSIHSAMLMRDGRFAFVMQRERGDLRSQIDEKVLKCDDDIGPFSKDEVEEIMYRIARGVDWLHNHDIVHRDIKASNVLTTGEWYVIADFECSVGVVGTGFWRAPEILQACQDRTIHQKPELFSKASDAYSYGMTCYEVLTGKFPFQDESVTISDVIEGKHPHVPEFVDAKYKDLLHWCWQLDPMARPSFDEILSFLEANSKSRFIRKKKLQRMKVCEGGHALLGCSNSTHALKLLECATSEDGSYVCKLCLEIGNGEVYHCASCGDFDLHPKCARVSSQLVSILHPHDLKLYGPFNYPDNHVCYGCLQDLEGSQWIYRCETRGCDFYLHAQCGKYVDTISHANHNEHKLLFIFNLTSTSSSESMIHCEGCKIGIRPKELVYHCKECNFNIHPNCALGNLIGS